MLGIPQIHRLLLSSAFLQGAGLFATTLVGIQLARYLGPSSYGIYALIMAAIASVSVIGQFGFPLLATKEAARSLTTGERPERVIGWFARNASVFVLGVTAITSCVAFLLWPHQVLGRNQLIGFGGATLVTVGLLAVFAGLLRGFGRNLAGQAAEFVLRPTATALILLFLHEEKKMSIEGALGAQAVAVAAAILTCVGLLPRSRASGHGSASPYQPERWIPVSTAFMATGLLLVLNANYPIIIAGFFVNPAQVGVFRVALASAALLGLPAAAANITVAPIVAKLAAAEDTAELRLTIAHTTVATFATTLLGGAIVAIAGRTLIKLAFGAEYLGAYEPLLILTAAQIVVAAFGISASFLNMTHREKLVIRAFAICVPLGLVVSIPLTWRLGINGAAIGNLVMVTLWHWYVIFRNRREVEVPIFILPALRALAKGSGGG